MFERLVGEFAGLDSAVFSGIWGNPVRSQVAAGAEAFRAHAADSVIGVGGGAALDVAKAVALMLTHGGPIDQYYGENAIPSPVLPIIAVPTTGGTGSISW